MFVQNEANAVKARPVIANYNEVSQAMGQAIEAVLLGKGQPQQELDQAAEQADQTLADWASDRRGRPAPNTSAAGCSWRRPPC